MLKLSGLNLNAKLYGTVTISAIPYKSPLVGAVTRQRIIVTTSDGTELVCEDQIIKAETQNVFPINISDAEMDRADREMEARNG